MEQKISLEKALEMVMDELKGINVPIKFINEIGIPIANSVNNLNEIIKAIVRDKENQQQEEDPDEPKIEMVDVLKVEKEPGSIE